MNPNRRKLLENKLRRMVREELKNSKPNSSKSMRKINEGYDADGGIYDDLQNALWEDLGRRIEPWVRKSVSALKKYARQANRMDPDSVDVEELIHDFMQEFVSYNMWEEFTGDAHNL